MKSFLLLRYFVAFFSFLCSSNIYAQSTGDYRSNGAVNFASATGWQRYDGSAWVAAPSAPTSADGIITIRNHIATVSGNVMLDQVIVEGTLIVNDGVTLTLNDGTGTDLQVNNRLTTIGTGTIAGAGSFVLGAQTIFTVGHPSGVLGSITNTGGRTFTAGASYVFNGTVAQSTGFAGLTIGNPQDVTLSNTAGITLDVNNLVVTRHLNIATNVNFTMGASVTDFTAGSIYSKGTVTNCVNATISPAFTNAAWAFPKGIYNDGNTAEPTTEPTALYFNQAATTAHIYWMANGNGKRRIVVLKAGSAISNNAPIDNTIYTANTAFGSGDALDGGFVVYNGNANQVNVTGLTNGTTYHIAVFEYNGDCANASPNYKTGTPLTSNFVAQNRDFITLWNLSNPGSVNTTLSFGVATSGTVNYTWQEVSPSNASGSGTFSGTTLTITGLPAGAVIRLSIQPTNFQHININNGINRGRLVDIEQWGSTAWTSMLRAFRGCSNLSNYTATDNPNLSNVTIMNGMFQAATAFNGNISTWNTSAVTDMGSTFASASAFNQAIGTWNTSAVTNMNFMFSSATTFNQAIGTWNTSAVNNMSGMFQVTAAFNGNIGAWNTSAVTNMSNMFDAATAFNQNIGNWNTSAVNNMSGMFQVTAAFNGNIGAWNTSAVTNMSNMFNSAYVFNQAIGTWNTSAVTNMSSMFSNANAFNQNIGAWNTSAVTNMSFMFSNAYVFNQNIGSWNTSAVTNMGNMFTNASAFNQNIGTWNTGAVTNMSYMFQNATAFNQNIGTWTLNSAVTLTNTLNNCGMNTANYEATLAGWAGQAVTGRSLGAVGLRYCDATNRTTLTTTKTWTISGDVLNCTKYYRTTGNVTFASPTNWESSLDNSAWSVATTAPNFNDNTIIIQSGHTAIASANIILDELTVQSGGTLQVSTGIVLSVPDGTGTDLTIQSGGTLNIQGTGTLAGAGSFTLDAGGTFQTAHINGFNAIGLTGTKTFTTGANYIFNGTALQTINNPASLSANNITVNNSAGTTLSQDITITGALTLTSGDLDLNGNNITLNGTLAEDRANNHIVLDNTAVNDANQGGGIIFTGNVSNISTEIAGSGLYLQRTAGSDYAVTVIRKHYRGGGGIKRIYQVTGTPTGTNTIMRIYYASDELSGISGTLRLYRWQSGTGWQKATDAGSGYSNGTNGSDYVEATGINAFSHWTIGGETISLPITLLSFEGRRQDKENVNLTWKTATEINNKGFEIESSTDGTNFTQISFVDGAGNSTTIKNYSLNVNNANDAYYRLKQIDFDGTFAYSNIVFVKGGEGKIKIYPNPTSENISIELGDWKSSDVSSFEIQDLQGKTLSKGNLKASKTSINIESLPKGMYLLQVLENGKKTTQKIVIQ
jgi:surface protein